MGLRDLQYQEDYRSGYADIVDDLIRPSLAQSTEYWRAVGYFSSTALEAFGAPLGEFIRNGGHIKLVTSVELSQGDLAAIDCGAHRPDICMQRLTHIIDTDFAEGAGDGVTRLVRLLELGRLEIKIAVPKTGTGIYHEKIGLFMDGRDWVAFTGSANESRNAFENNRECVDVFPSWSSQVRASRKKAHFRDLWQGRDLGLDVFTFPEAARRKLIKVCREKDAKRSISRPNQCTVPDKWRHQEEAVEKFLAAERGVLNMATGTGKTRTALSIVHTLHESNKVDTTIVSTQGNDLLDQWYPALLSIRKEIGAKVFRHYKKFRDIEEFLLEPSNSILLVSREPLAAALRGLLGQDGDRLLLIHDEVHGLGSPANRKRLGGLSDRVKFRLGLSATPEREYDVEGTQFVMEHIGPEVMRFDLGDAIRRGVLAPFNYHPLPYEVTPEDRQRVRNVYKQQAARAAAGDPMRDEEVWMEIARVYKTSIAKLPVFEDFIDNNQKLLSRCIIFVETQEYGHNVLEIVHKYRADFHTYFTGEESDTLKRFAKGDLECLITCHRLSEGIDIRSLNSVILFSSARARLETIQRMGRCLRTDPSVPEKVANVIDFVRQSPDEDDAWNVDNEREEWLSSLSEIRQDGSIDGA